MSAPRKPKARPKRIPALKAPQAGDDTALVDLKCQRALLLKRLNSRKITARDLATISAELRKVNASISIVESASSKGGIDEDELASRAETVREMLQKTKTERDRLRLAIVEATAEAEVELGTKRATA